MKTLALFLSLLISFFAAKAQIIDRAPTTSQNFRAVQGGSQKVNIDTKTPLNELVNRLEKPWQFVETGKMYWIGYTDDMYSIAAHGDDAIKPLLLLIDTTKNLKAKYGAANALHLIGINSMILGRFIEKFNDKNARNALLSLLKYDDIGEEVMSLLLRDPWQSDIPTLFDCIGKYPSAWYIVSALNQYQLKDYPLNNDIPENLLYIPYSLEYTNNSGDIFDNQLYSAIYSIKMLNNPLIKVDSQLFDYKTLWGAAKSGLDGIFMNSNKNTLAKLLYNIVSDEYGMVGSKVNYYVNNDKLYLCSPQQSRQIVLQWWNKQTLFYKKSQFIADTAKQYSMFIMLKKIPVKLN